MSENTYLHFTLGPVQGFVAEARRTRDFWAGSFLLSWLSAVAMRKVEKLGGEIIFPSLDQDYLNWLDGKGTGKAPQQGRIPNRFKARFTGKADGRQIEKAVRDAWENLADVVYRNDLKLYESAETKRIWDRQVAAFWDIAWVVTDAADDNSALDRRKNWRTYLPTDEPGIKCMMMDGWQELSGLPEPGAPYPSEAELGKFWNPIRQPHKSDFREGEMLCAIAFIKRRFVHHFHKVEMGWRVPHNVPSVAFMAGLRWLEQVLEQAAEKETVKQAWENYLKLSDELNDSLGYDKRPTGAVAFKCLERLPGIPEKWKALDGNLFHRSALENSNIFPGEKSKLPPKAKAVSKALGELNKVAGVDAASPFYAVLRMDGDDMGKLLRSLRDDGKDESAVSQALDQFTKAVQPVIADYDGFLIYAGGDDVLAILPLDKALVCAARLREKYLQAFRECHLENGSTLSGAICFAHIKMPLTRVLEESHELLDDVAKTQTGRDAIAVRVLKPGGQTVQWAQPWRRALQDGNSDAGVVVDQLAREFQQADQEEPQFSSKFFFKIHEYFGVLSLDRKREKNPPTGFGVSDVADLLLMAFRNSGSNRTLQALDDGLPRQLLEQCLPYRREWQHGIPELIPQSTLPDIDGAMLVRFLAQKGAE